MAKVIFLVGLCGSGKTRKGRQMEKEGFVWVEGIHSKPKELLKLVDNLRTGKNCVAEEFQTLTAQYRDQIRTLLQQTIPGVEVEFWFFEKDIVKATRNILERPDNKKPWADHILINGRTHDVYDITEGSIILPIEPHTEYQDEP